MITPETPGLSITFDTLSARRSFETKDYWTSLTAFTGFPFALVFTWVSRKLRPKTSKTKTPRKIHISRLYKEFGRHRWKRIEIENSKTKTSKTKTTTKTKTTQTLDYFWLLHWLLRNKDHTWDIRQSPYKLCVNGWIRRSSPRGRTVNSDIKNKRNSHDDSQARE